MPPLASEQFHAITSAKPECVWDALTTTGVPLDYLHGMTVDTDWSLTLWLPAWLPSDLHTIILCL